MFNKNILTALIISLLTLLGLAYFSSAGFSNANISLSTGQIATLVTSALAWLCLILFNQREPAIKPDNNTIAQSVNALVTDIQSALGSQISATEAELAQVKSLMDNAIDDLVDSFISLEASARIEQKLVMLLATSETKNDNDELNPFKDKQLKSKQLLNDVANKLSTLIKNTSQNQLASKALKKIEKEAEFTVKNLELVLDKLGNSVDAIFIDELRNTARKLHASINEAGNTADKLYADSQLYAQESKEIAGKINEIMDENTSNIALVAEEIAVTTAQIEEDVKTAVKSLQFQDMTTQLITQCSERQKMMQSILASVNINADDNKISTPELEVKLIAALAKLKQVSNVRMKQFNVDGGSVELF
jgi:methyl-accepting chemotaxis protein